MWSLKRNRSGNSGNKCTTKKTSKKWAAAAVCKPSAKAREQRQHTFIKYNDANVYRAELQYKLTRTKVLLLQQKDCWSFCSISRNSDNALVRARSFLHLVCGHISIKITHSVQMILDDNRRLLTWLSSKQNAKDLNEQWEQIKETVHPVLIATHHWR